MREQAIDTSKVRLCLPQEAQKSASGTSGAVKRAVSARSTPEEKATKRTKSKPGVADAAIPSIGTEDEVSAANDTYAGIWIHLIALL
ncbi:hypothetical protein QE152_g37596 [Popillia japonica]|uniref:Uncharacterized protein n=1 Tax=Popillia japonica TaxID=7064 RepID=A0AAW1I981_POPJA